MIGLIMAIVGFVVCILALLTFIFEKWFDKQLAKRGYVRIK
jgi:uncharacterized membrane protein YsdA (DUF1294 family)